MSHNLAKQLSGFYRRIGFALSIVREAKLDGFLTLEIPTDAPFPGCLI